jgi:tetratricopeptide (TPR) repeat protein
VIEELGVELLGSERQLIEQRPTDHLKAYQAYLQAIDLDSKSSVTEWDRRTVDLLEQATKLDPDFLAAWYRLSRHHSFHYLRYDPTEARLSAAKEALQMTEFIDSDHPLTRLARGYYFYYGFREYDLAQEEFVAASEVSPNDSEVIRAIAYIDRRRGKLSECAEGLKAALNVDPRNLEVVTNLASTYSGLRRFEDATRLWDRAIALDPGNDENIWRKASDYIRWKGDLSMARTIMKPEPGQSPFEHAYGWYNIYTYERNYPAAIEQARRMEEDVPKIRALKRYFIALAETRQSGAAAARLSLESAALACEEVLEVSPGDAVSHEMLAVMYAFLGKSEAAVREAKLATDLTAKDAFAGPAFLENMAVVYGITDRQEEAVVLVDRLLATPYYKPMTVHTLRLDPKWDPLRDHPRSQELLKKHSNSL